MNKTVKILLTIAVLVIVIIIVSIISFKYLTKKTEEKQINTVLDYFSYIEEHNYEKMYDLISSSSKEKISKDEFIERNKNIYEGLDATGFEINIESLQKIDNSNKEILVYYFEKFFTSAGKIEIYYNLSLVKEKREYKINWSSKLIYPTLEDNYKIRIKTIHATRGTIFDRHGVALAYDGKLSQVGLVPGKLGENRNENIEKVSELLGISVEKIEKALSASYVKDDTFVALKKISKSNDELKEKLLEIQGVMISNIDGRVYKLGEEAAHLIGYVQTINAEELKKHEGENYTTTSVIGKSGLEYYYEKTLRGIDGAEIYIEDENGNKLDNILFQEKQNGYDVTLTIDSELQKDFYDQMKDDEGFFVVMRPGTGELVALVSTPSYDSNDFVLGMSNEKWESLNNDEKMPLYNRFKQYYCPGSTFKPITAAIALTEGIIDEETEFNYTGTSWQKDSSWGNYNVTTLTSYSERKNVKNAIIRSDNIFFAQLALKIGSERLSNGLNKIGFGKELDIPQFSLKNSQYLNKDTEFTDIKLASTGYGQGDILVNPIHMAQIYSAFVNKGYMVKPYLEYDYGNVEYSEDRVFSESASEIVKKAMIEVVNSNAGTANDARMLGMTILGKTGTAELKKSKDDKESGTLGWFNCITIGRQPEELLIVGMVENVQDNASGGSHYVISKIKKVLSK